MSSAREHRRRQRQQQQCQQPVEQRDVVDAPELFRELSEQMQQPAAGAYPRPEALRQAGDRVVVVQIVGKQIEIRERAEERRRGGAGAGARVAQKGAQTGARRPGELIHVKPLSAAGVIMPLFYLKNGKMSRKREKNAPTREEKSATEDEPLRQTSLVLRKEQEFIRRALRLHRGSPPIFPDPALR